MTILNFLILCLAAYRLTHFIVFDKIFEPIRNIFVKRSYSMNLAGGLIVYFELKGGPVRRCIGKIMNCFWCAGLWIALVVSTLYWLFPILIGPYIVLAIAAVVSLIETVWAKSVGFPEMEEKDENG